MHEIISRTLLFRLHFQGGELAHLASDDRQGFAARLVHRELLPVSVFRRDVHRDPVRQFARQEGQPEHRRFLLRCTQRNRLVRLHDGFLLPLVLHRGHHRVRIQRHRHVRNSCNRLGDSARHHDPLHLHAFPVQRNLDITAHVLERQVPVLRHRNRHVRPVRETVLRIGLDRRDRHLERSLLRQFVRIAVGIHAVVVRHRLTVRLSFRELERSLRFTAFPVQRILPVVLRLKEHRDLVTRAPEHVTALVEGRARAGKHRRHVGAHALRRVRTGIRRFARASRDHKGHRHRQQRLPSFHRLFHSVLC